MQLLFAFVFRCSEDLHGFTPLMEAAANGHEIIVQCLLQHVRIANVVSCVFILLLVMCTRQTP